MSVANYEKNNDDCYNIFVIIQPIISHTGQFDFVSFPRHQKGLMVISMGGDSTGIH